MYDVINTRVHFNFSSPNLSTLVTHFTYIYIINSILTCYFFVCVINYAFDWFKWCWVHFYMWKSFPVFSLLCIRSSFSLISFSSIWSTLIFLIGLLVINSYSLFIYKKIFTSPLFLKDIFTEHCIVGKLRVIVVATVCSIKDIHGTDFSTINLCASFFLLFSSPHFVCLF